MAADVPTWRQIEEAALNDNVLHRAVSMHRAGLVTREQALMIACLALAGIRKDLVDNEVRRLGGMPLSRPVTPGT